MRLSEAKPEQNRLHWCIQKSASSTKSTLQSADGSRVTTQISVGNSDGVKILAIPQLVDVICLQASLLGECQLSSSPLQVMGIITY